MLKTTQETLYERAHREAAAAPVREIVTLLQDVLSPRLTAYVAGVPDIETVSRLARGEDALALDREAEQRLRTAYEMVLILLRDESSATVRSWFVGLNPELGDVPPALVARENRCEDALTAAHIFSAYG